MSVLTLVDIDKTYGENNVLQKVSLQINSGEKVGLVGANGAGKTTVLKIIAGQEEADGGQVFLARGITWGYLEQKPEFLQGTTLWEYLKDAVRDIFSLKEELHAIEQEMALAKTAENAAVLEGLMERYGFLAHIFESKGGYALENRLHAVARGLGFQDDDLGRPIGEFSGGEGTRAQLAALLLAEPELLLLDEPTNNLDLEAREWLENYLRNWSGTLLAVSHDRYFLDKIAGRIAFLEAGALQCYRGNYSEFTALRQLEKTTQENAYKKQQALREKELNFIRTSAADERSKRQARSREKRLARMGPVTPPARAKALRLNFSFAGRSSRAVLAFAGVSRAFGGDPLFAGATFEIEQGDRVALLGPNGAGKTTLLRLITGEDAPSSGDIALGHGVRITYFDQEQKKLNLERTLLETMLEAPGLNEPEARKRLSHFLFYGDAVFKKAGDLSGGERSRLALARAALSGGNFLIMDEPTNHLDIKGVEELETALASYPGTLLVVSHDRYFISRFATKILEIKDGKVRLCKGNYQEYTAARSAEAEKMAAIRRENPAAAALREKKAAEREVRERVLAQRRERRRLEKLFAAAEEKIGRAEEKVSSLQAQLADPAVFGNFTRAREVAEKFHAARHSLEGLYSEWEKIAAALEALPPEGDIKTSS